MTESELLERVLGILERVLGILSGLQVQMHDISGRLAATVKEFYTVDEIARLTGRSTYTVRRWVAEKRIQAQRVNGTGPKGRLLVPRAEIDKLIQLGKGTDIAGVTVSAS